MMQSHVWVSMVSPRSQRHHFVLQEPQKEYGPVNPLGLMLLSPWSQEGTHCSVLKSHHNSVL